MSRFRRRLCKYGVPLLIGAVVLWLNWARAPAQPQAGGEKKAPIQPAPMLLVGTASCSARGCHGRIEPMDDPVEPSRCRQNEYAQWLRDPHADAYRALFNDRSRQIARLLGANTKAHEDGRCLACHVNPNLASLPAQSAIVKDERQFGVGCESCHGPAGGWLIAHTAPDWLAKKHGHAMPDLGDPVVQAKTCTGCHVGAPGQDVNHDLIAAGHPRLNFEFGAYRANMPPHWRMTKKSEGHLWAVGQVVSAEAALELLIQRTKNGPWPELAEYDCFACHHSLSDAGWRRNADRARRPLGAMPWGSWYFGLLRPLAGELPTLDALERKMQESMPDRAQAAERAAAVLRQLKNVHDQLAGAKNDMGEKLARQRVLDRFKNGKLAVEQSWDGVEQLYLALQALEPSPALDKLAGERAFPPGFDGPASWSQNGNQPFDMDGFLGKLRHLQKP